MTIHRLYILKPALHIVTSLNTSVRKKNFMFRSFYEHFVFGLLALLYYSTLSRAIIVSTDYNINCQAISELL